MLERVAVTMAVVRTSEEVAVDMLQDGASVWEVVEALIATGVRELEALELVELVGCLIMQEVL